MRLTNTEQRIATNSTALNDATRCVCQAPQNRGRESIM